MNQAYINALLADATYVSISPSISTEKLIEAFAKRLTSSQANYLVTNFEVIGAIDTFDIPLLGSGFDATVFRGRTGTEYAGQVFVSTRGTEPPGVDIWGADVDLAVNVAARTQIIDMVNWWLKGTAAKGAQVAQIKWDPLRVKPGTINTPEPGLALAAAAAGTGELVGVTSVHVNGHSLGGHLASAFARIFGGNNVQPGSVRVESINTFNSAGFNGTKSEPFFTQMQALLGTGLNSFAGVSRLQTNYFADNGINVTTNDWWFTQMGSRVELFQEEGTGLTNHSMYRLTDLLALGNALAKLDVNLSIAQLNALAKAGSDTLDGKGGADYLEGGTGTDTYRFGSSFGKDTVVDADGLGTIEIAGQTLGQAKAAGQLNTWTAKLGSTAYVLRVLDDSTSATGKRLPCRKNEQIRLLPHGCIDFVAMNFNKSTIATLHPTKTRAMKPIKPCAIGVFAHKTKAVRVGGMGRLA